MIKILWFLHRPERDIEGFEDWYQQEHVPIGMRQERLQQFRISRSFYPQPRFVAERMGTEMPRAYRFSEGYWRSLADIRVCYSSPEGRAAIGHGPLNMGAAVPPGPRPSVILEEAEAPVPRGLDFDLRSGRYRAPLACKLFGVLRLGPAAAEWDAAVAPLVRRAADHPDLRGLVLGKAVPEVIRLGRFAQLPAEGAEPFDRTVEAYFESPEALDRFCASEAMTEFADLAAARAEAVVWDAAQIQEVFFTSKGEQPLTAGWRDFYRTA